jgi:hypothetical protein
MLNWIRASMWNILIAICIFGFVLVVTAIGVVKGIMLTPGYIWRVIEDTWAGQIKIWGTVLIKTWKKIIEEE